MSVVCPLCTKRPLCTNGGGHTALIGTERIKRTMRFTADGSLTSANESYFRKAFGNTTKLAEEAHNLLIDVEYDTMIGTGLSGSLVIPRLAEQFGKKWFIVRKSDNNHAENHGEGEIGHRWIFVDDFIATGRTRKRVKEVIQDIADEYGFSTEYVGTYAYQPGTYQS